MGHSISGIVSSQTSLELLSLKLGCDGYVNAAEFWGFLPLDDTDLDRVDFFSPGFPRRGFSLCLETTH